MVEQCPFKAWVAGSSPAALTINPLGLLDCISPRIFCQEILTHTQPTACEPPHLNIVHFARDRLSLLAQHDFRACVPHIALGCLHVGFVDGHHPSSHTGTQRMQSESLSVRDVDSCREGSGADSTYSPICLREAERAATSEYALASSCVTPARERRHLGSSRPIAN